MNYRTIAARTQDGDLRITVTGSAYDLLESDPNSFFLVMNRIDATLAVYELLCHEGFMDPYIDCPADVQAHKLDVLELLGNIEPTFANSYKAGWTFYDYGA